MRTGNDGLFRKEVLARRSDRLVGNINISVPRAWQLIGYGSLAVLAAIVALVALGSYARVEAVPGVVVLDRGFSPIISPRPGTVTSVNVREGQRVVRGTVLVRVAADERLGNGATQSQAALGALVQQDRNIALQEDRLRIASNAEEARLRARMSGLHSEVDSLSGQIVDQERLVSIAETEVREMQGLATRGFISRREMNTREAALISRRQQLSQLLQARSAKQAELLETERSITQQRAAALAQSSSLQSDRAAITQREAETEGGGGYALVAPISGTVTAVTARPGQPVRGQEQLLVIVPDDVTVRAELYVPTRAAGFIRPGQSVRVAVDAFPSQHFGTVPGRVLHMSSVAITRPLAGADSAPIYLAIVSLSEPSTPASGGRHTLLPGMNLTAYIVTEEHSLFSWLFDPFLAGRGN